MGGNVRVLLADDEPDLREFIAVICGSIQNLEVVAEAEDGEQALTKFKLEKPDLVLLDVMMPKVSGVSVVQSLKKASPKTEVVMLTSVNAIEVVRACLAAGARSYILKSSAPEEISSKISQARDAILAR